MAKHTQGETLWKETRKKRANFSTQCSSKMRFSDTWLTMMKSGQFRLAA